MNGLIERSEGTPSMGIELRTAGARTRARATPAPASRLLAAVREYRTRHRADIVASLLIAVAALVRLAFLAAGWPGTDSDESTMGLMALHILRLGEHPIFFYGQAYMGSIEAHLGALLFAIFGVSAVALKAGLVILYTGFLVALWLLLRRLFRPLRALYGLALLVFAGDNLLGLELHAFGGYLETLCSGALVTLLTVWLIATGGDGTATTRGTRRARAVGFAGWGLVAGLGIYSDPLVLPFIGCAALGLILACWAELRGRLGALTLAMLLLGLSPWVIYDLTAGTPGAAASFLQHPAQRQPPSAAPSGPSAGELLVDHLAGTIVVAVPDMTGGEALFAAGSNTWPPARWGSPGALVGAIVRGLWGLGVLFVIGFSLWLEARTLRGLLRVRPATWSESQRARAVRAIGCAAPLAASAITVVAFTVSDASAFAPWIYERYLVGLLIALPIAAGTLWEHLANQWSPLRALRHGVTERNSLASAVRMAVGVSFALVLSAALALPLVSAVQTTGEIPAQRAETQAQKQLMASLVAHGQTRVYSEFWTCYWVMFTSDERVICGVLNADLSRRASRYPPYDAAIDAAHPSVYVFPTYSPQAQELPSWAASQHMRVSTQNVAGQYAVMTLTP